MNMKKTILSLLLALLPLLAIADAVEINGIYYYLNEKTKQAEVTSKPNLYKGEVNIPDKVNYESVDYDVTSIGEYAFSNCNGLISISIPNSMTSVGYQAFSGCSGLNSVHITDLESWCKISFYHFNSNPLSYSHQLYLNGDLVTSLVIPNSVTSIGNYAFSRCWNFTSVTIPNSVTSIGAWAFSSCSGLTSVTIPSSVTLIGNGAFSYCEGLTSVNIPNSVTSIGKEAFIECWQLTSVTIPNSVISIGDWAFANCI